MDKSLVCPTCHVGMDENQLITSTWTVEVCPYCRAVVRKTDSFVWQDRDAITQDAVAAIDAWLRAEAAGRRQGFSMVRAKEGRNPARYSWRIVGIEMEGNIVPWSCTIDYAAENPSILEIRLSSNRGGEAIIDNPSSLAAVCAQNGLQPYTCREQAWESGGDEKTSITWGVRQFLATAPLTGGLFTAVVKRLDKAIRDAAMRLGLVAVG